VNVTWKITVRYGTVHYRTVQCITVHLIGRIKRSDCTLPFFTPSPSHIHIHKRNYFSTLSTRVFFRLSLFTISLQASMLPAATFSPFTIKIYKQHTVFIITTYFFLNLSSALHRTALHRTELHCTILHCTAP
jgi:hypothetical protein